jgi:flavorubredoxin
MDQHYQVSADVHVLPTHLALPGAGVLTVNSFIIMAKEPVLVDTGLGTDSEQFIAAVRAIIDPKDLRWIWLTHDDGDHTGSLAQLLELAPKARLATNALAALRMSTTWPVPLDRVYALTPGDTLEVGDRTLTAVRPPLFDNPMTTGLFDGKSGTLFSADAFGALLPAAAQDAANVADEDLKRGMVAWGTFDSPWAQLVEPAKFDELLERVRKLAPAMICSTHLPPAKDSTDRLLQVLASLPTADPFVCPDQPAFQQMLAQMLAAPAGS